MRFLACLLAVSWTVGCSSSDSGGGGLTGLGAKTPSIPNQVAGGDRDAMARRAQAERDAAVADLTPEQLAKIRADRTREADAIWARAQAARSHGQAAELYEDLAEGYPESRHAAEARYRQAVSLWRQREYLEAFDRFESYMSIAPVNPHRKQIERMVFRAGSVLLDRAGGFFQSDEPGLEMLRFVAQNFPAGSYADDALYRLGRYYQGQREWDIAVLSYKELLINHANSEWRYMTRLAMGDTYLERDQGPAYHAGFVDRDPREALPSEEAAPFAGPVRSSLELALEQFEVFLDRMAADPTRRAEYAAHIRYAEARARQLRGALADKEQRTANWYRQRGDARAASLYARAAQAWRDGSRRLGPRSSGATIRAQEPLPATSIPIPTTPAPVAPAPTEPAPTVPSPTPSGTSWPVMPVPTPNPAVTNAGTFRVPPPPPPPPLNPRGS